MHTLTIRLICCTALLGWQAFANAAVADGKTLHNANCIQCHAQMKGGDGSNIYTRTDRRVQDMPGLSKQVTRCTNSLGLAWTQQQHQDVVDYLNSSYYKFGVKP